MLEVEILVTPLDAVERQSEEGAVQVVLEVHFLVLPLGVVDRHSEGGFLTPMVILARHRWYSDRFRDGQVVLLRIFWLWGLRAVGWESASRFSGSSYHPVRVCEWYRNLN